MKKTTLLCALSLIASLVSLRADMTIVGEGSNDAKVLPVTLRMSDGKLEIEAQQGTVIFLPSEKKMIVVMPEHQMYMERDLAPMTPGPDSATPVVAPPVLTRTGKKQTINGFECEQVLSKTEKGLTNEFWFSQQGPSVMEMLPTFQALQKQGLSKVNMDWVGFMAANPDLATFPIQVISSDASGNERSRFTVKSVSKLPIPSSTFSPPTGFTEMKIPGFSGEATMSTPGGSADSATPLQQLQKLQQEIVQSGKPPTPEQLQQLQDLAKQLRGQ